MCECVGGSAQCVLIVSASTVSSHCWKHVWVFVVSDVGIWEKPAFERALPCGMTFALR